MFGLFKSAPKLEAVFTPSLAVAREPAVGAVRAAALRVGEEEVQAPRALAAMHLPGHDPEGERGRRGHLHVLGRAHEGRQHVVVRQVDALRGDVRLLDAGAVLESHGNDLAIDAGLDRDAGHGRHGAERLKADRNRLPDRLRHRDRDRSFGPRPLRRSLLGRRAGPKEDPKACEGEHPGHAENQSPSVHSCASGPDAKPGAVLPL